MAKKTVNPEDVPDVTQVKGYECLTPIHKLRPSVAARVVAMLDDDASPQEQAGRIVAAIEEHCVEDQDAWNRLFREDGVVAIVELSLSYAVKLLGANG